MSKPVILTGLRANNDLHIGNYLGALLPIVDMARTKSTDYQINLFVPDLHSFTTPIDHTKLQEQIMQNLRVFVASGLPLDNENVHLYRQSYIPAHSELTIILNCYGYMGELSRMTQYKEKSTKQDNVSVGLFDYPVLMASDILLYNAEYVPVGDDQTQHLEFTRDIAERMNRKFGELFVVPKPVKEQHALFGKDQGLRIKDLQDPAKKMSKSDESGKGVIFMNDSPKEARKKIMSATTDSHGKVTYNPTSQPGIANLLQIYSLLKGQTIQESAKEFEGQTQYGEFKACIADVVERFLSDFQVRLDGVNNSELIKKLQKDEAKMNAVASQTLDRVHRAVGLRR